MLAGVMINWVAILVAGIVNMVLGTVWYSPALFGKNWMRLVGIKELKPEPKTMGGMFVVALLIAVVLTYFVSFAGATTFVQGMEIGILAAFGFVVSVGASSSLVSKGNWELWGINGGYWVVSLAVMGGILAAMR
jgi:hypothetical protein